MNSRRDDNDYCTNRRIILYPLHDGVHAVFLYRKKYTWPSGGRNIRSQFLLWNGKSVEKGQWAAKEVIIYKYCRWNSIDKVFTLAVQNSPAVYHRLGWGTEYRYVIPPYMKPLPFSTCANDCSSHYKNEHIDKDMDKFHASDIVRAATNILQLGPEKKKVGSEYIDLSRITQYEMEDGTVFSSDGGKLYKDGLLLIDLTTDEYTRVEPFY